ncbi:DNA-binding protein [Myxococcus eversor]|uniref:DNA-binding protein n=1 Tax=Myxococcus eversor TaxID=2709661 RepID=UPI0013D0F1FF|nr:DNA-binding protein [Myxococcus eversor]
MTPFESSFPRFSRALFTALCVFIAACDDSDESTSTPIAEARAQATGTQATIEGYVSVQPGAFASALGDEGFALQDATSGVYVKMEQKQSFNLGSRVRVTGTLDEQNKLRILKANPEDVELLSGSQTVSAKTVTTGAVNESVEGQIIKVTGDVTQTFQDDSPYGYKLYVNDGSGEVQVFVHVSAGFDASGLQALKLGDTLTVVGLAAQYETTYEVAPRSPGDLTVAP